MDLKSRSAVDPTQLFDLDPRNTADSPVQQYDTENFLAADDTEMWDYIKKKDPATFTGKYADADYIYSDPAIEKRYNDLANEYAELIMPDENVFGGFIKDVMSNPASMLMGGALGSAIFSGLGGFDMSSLFSGSGVGAPTGWTSGFDLAGGGALEGAGSAGWTSGFDLPMGGGNMADWTSGFDLPMGGSGSEWTSGYDIPGGGGPFSTTNGGSTVGDVAQSWESNAGQPGVSGPAGGSSWQNILQQLMSGGTGTGNNGLPNLLSGLTGLFDIFGTGPFSARGITEKAAGRADPFMEHRGPSGDMLMNLMTNPGSFNLTPGAQFTMQQGTENLTRSNAAKGLLGSGNILADIMRFGEGVASQDYYNTVDRLMPMSGATTGSPAAAGSITSGQLTNRNSALRSISQGLAPTTPGGNTSSSGGLLQSLSGIGSGISSILGLFS